MSEDYWVQRLAEATTAKGRKRGAICELKTTSTRQRATGDHAGEATRVSVEDVRTAEWEEDPGQQPDGFWNTSVLCNIEGDRHAAMMMQRCWTWLGHVLRMGEERMVKRVFMYRAGLSPVPPHPLSHLMGVCHLPLHTVAEVARDRGLWKDFNVAFSNLENKYQQLEKIGEGSCGRIYAGYRRSDGLPVAIKFVPLLDVHMQDIVLNEKTHSIPMEVLIMHRMAGGPESTAVSLMEWFQQDEGVVLVIERPVPCVDLMTYMEEPLREHQNKNIMKQLVDAAIEMSAKGVFHGDIMASNILVETGSNVPRVRIIDFGCSCLVGDMPFSGVSDYYRNIRQQAGPITVEHLGLVLEQMLDSNPYFDSETNIHTSLTQGCRDFLEECKDPDPNKRATLEQLQEHPWINQC